MPQSSTTRNPKDSRLDAHSENGDIADVVSQINGHIEQSLEGNGRGSYTYLIGNNGLGKSRILRELELSYANVTDNRVGAVLCITNALYDRFDVGKNHPKIKYLGARNASNAVFHTAIDRALAKYVLTGIAETRRFVERFSKTAGVEVSLTMPGVLRPDRKTLADHVDRRKLKDVPLSKRLGGTENLNIIKDLIYTTVTFKGLTKPKATALLAFLDLNPEVVVQVKKKGHKREYPFSDLSSGEKNRILTAAKLLSHAEHRCLILLDEPETSLHVHWQRTFHASLVEMLSGIKHFHVVIATHSPIIVSECSHMSDVKVVVIDDDEEADTDSAFPPLISAFSEASQIESYDGVMLDLFKIAPINTKSIHERVTDILMDAVDGNLDTIEAKPRLEALLDAEGISPMNDDLVRRAIRVISDSQFKALRDETPG
jgi:ABC-type transport system involved in cytochrome c biogenesis ATPase subunit